MSVSPENRADIAEDLAKIYAGNMMRVYRQVWK